MRNRISKPCKPKRTKKWMDIINQLSIRNGLKCYYCGIDLTGRLSIDHIVPKIKGGSDQIDNLVLCCIFCNRAKFSFELGDFLLWLAHVRSSKFSCKIINDLKNDEYTNEFDNLRKDFWS